MPALVELRIAGNAVLSNLSGVTVGTKSLFGTLQLSYCNFSLGTIQTFMDTYFSSTESTGNAIIDVLVQQSGILVPTEVEPWATLVSNGFTIDNYTPPP
jgi:hypothetical protein